MSRLSAALPPLERAASRSCLSFTTSCRNESARASLSTSVSIPRCLSTPNRSRGYAIYTTPQVTSYLTIPTPSTSAHKDIPFKPPTLSQIRSHLPKPQTPSMPQIRVGTVSRVGTMMQTVQISFNTQSFDNWLQRNRQRTTRILAHEPTGYLRAGDVVEFARFTPLTMAERYESGKLDRRGGGVRYEVHRVITPFGEPVEKRVELAGREELWESRGIVEFKRRAAELTRPWNTDRQRRMGILEGMCEAVGMEVERMRKHLASRSNKTKIEKQGIQQTLGRAGTTAGERILDEMSEAQKGMAAELQKLQQQSPSARAEEMS